MLSEQEARSIVKKILSLSKAENAFVSLDSEEVSHLRFARNTPSTSGHFTNTRITVSSTFGNKTGSASLNQGDGDSLKTVVTRSEELAMLAPEDPEYLPPLGPQSYPAVRAYSPRTASAGPEVLAAGAEECIRQATAKGLIAAGFIRLSSRSSAIGTSRSLFGYQRSTIASISETVRTPDGEGSGWVSRAFNNIDDLKFKDLSSIAVDKARRSHSPRRLEPREYVTILEPSCVAELVQSLVSSMDARSADEGRNYFSKPGGGNKLGEQLFPATVSIYSDPSDPQVPGSMWGESGLPQTRVDWVKNGVVTNLRSSRFWAGKQGASPVPSPSNIIMKGGTGSLADLIRSTKDGILVTSFWYIRGVDPRTLLLTGLTRDGVFKIENGTIAYPVMNFRWNDSPASVLKNIEAMSRASRVPSRESGSSSIVIPALRVKKFNFSSLSEAV